MRVEALDFELPPERIATEPAEPRDAARLMVVRLGASGVAGVEHRRVGELDGVLSSGDRLVFNQSRVVPARFVGRMAASGGRVEGLWLRDHGDGCWAALVRAKRPRAGRLMVLDVAGSGSAWGVRLVEPSGEGDGAGAWVVRPEVDDGGGWRPWTGGTVAFLERAGLPPLPPYIRAARVRAGRAETEAGDASRYQTVYASSSAGPGGVSGGSVAAPTAGLHFTPELLERLSARGVERSMVTLHVGVGTFRPIESSEVGGHVMHREWCSLEPAGEGVLSRPSGRLVAVGTTSARTLESFAGVAGAGGAVSGWLETDLFIRPGYRWRVVRGLLTNFHLPRSTLLALVGSLLPGGVSELLGLYAEAIGRGYRFYSYGDAMLILPGRAGEEP